jgi:catechol 2,3-dioxygenase-like lactoylglutathione lyase family enzyme
MQVLVNRVSTPTTHGGWHEAVVCVRDLDRWIRALDQLFGWQVDLRGDIDARLLTAWQLPTGTRGRDAVLTNPADPPRCVRLVQLEGVPQVEIRSSGNHWDTGGIFSLLAYVRDVDATFAAAQALGWSAYHDPVDMEFGPRLLRNVVLRAWDSVSFGIYRVQKPTPPEPAYAKAAMPFNGQQSVRAIGPAREFYRDVLGWTAWFDDVIHLTCNNFGMPENFVGRMPKSVIIAAGGEESPGVLAHGQVELVEWVGFSGVDYAPRAVPPNLGIVALRVPARDARARADEIRARGGQLWSEPARATLAPYGEVTLFGVRTPDGALIEYFSPA